MKRVLLDLAVVILFTLEYFFEQSLPTVPSSWLTFVAFNPLLLFVGTASLVAFGRAAAEQRVFSSPIIPSIGIVEWAFLVVLSYALTCCFDVKLHPPENFITVFGFNLFLLLLPALIVSTGTYLLGRTVSNTRRTKI